MPRKRPAEAESSSSQNGRIKRSQPGRRRMFLAAALSSDDDSDEEEKDKTEEAEAANSAAAARQGVRRKPNPSSRTAAATSSTAEHSYSNSTAPAANSRRGKTTEKRTRGRVRRTGIGSTRSRTTDERGYAEPINLVEEETPACGGRSSEASVRRAVAVSDDDEGSDVGEQTMNLIRQLDDDERMARDLQEQYDREANGNADLSSSSSSSGSDNHGEWTTPPRPPFRGGRGSHSANNLTASPVAGSSRERAVVERAPFLVGMLMQLADGQERRIGPSGRGRGGRGRVVVGYPPRDEVSRHFARLLVEGTMRAETDNGAGNTYEALLDLAEHLGEAKPPSLTPAEIGMLPLIEFCKQRKMGAAAKSSSSADEFGVACTVCMTNYEPKEQQRLLPCSHKFHKNCIDEWLGRNATCPICRHDIKEGIQQSM